MDVQVVHSAERSRFEAEAEGETAFLSYEVHGSTVVMPHTVVPRALEGRGIAGELTRTAVAWAREQSLEIDAQCSYVRSWLGKHPDA